MYDSRDDIKPQSLEQGDFSMERELMQMPKAGALQRWTDDARDALNKGKGLPHLNGDWGDLHTHYTYTKAIEDGGLDLPKAETQAMAEEMSRRMDTTLNILDKQGMLQPLGHGVRLADGADNGFNQGIAYVPDMRLFVVTSHALEYGDGKRRVFTPDEFNELYERPEDYS